MAYLCPRAGEPPWAWVVVNAWDPLDALGEIRALLARADDPVLLSPQPGR